MRLRVVDTPYKAGSTNPNQGRWVTFHVMSGTVLLADNENALNAGGLPLETHDGLTQLLWYGDLWIKAAAGTTAEIELVIP